VLQWWVEAGAQLKSFAAYFLRAVPLNQVQLDELSAGLRAGRAGDRRGAEAIERRARSPAWGWTAMAPESQRRLSVQGGDRLQGATS
jgi:hypothetical protein